MRKRTYGWYTASSADDQHHDQELDLEALGNPGGGSWAVVYPDGDLWTWEVYNTWLLEDACVIAFGSGDSEPRAKAAVEKWIRRHLGWQLFGFAQRVAEHYGVPLKVW